MTKNAPMPLRFAGRRLAPATSDGVLLDPAKSRGAVTGAAST